MGSPFTWPVSKSSRWVAQSLIRMQWWPHLSHNLEQETSINHQAPRTPVSVHPSIAQQQWLIAQGNLVPEEDEDWVILHDDPPFDEIYPSLPLSWRSQVDNGGATTSQVWPHHVIPQKASLRQQRDRRKATLVLYKGGPIVYVVKEDVGITDR